MMMPVKLISRRQFLALPETICLSCARSWPNSCLYWKLKDAEKGLEKMGATAVKAVMKGNSRGRVHDQVVYKVVGCPYFEKAKEGATVSG